MFVALCYLVFLNYYKKYCITFSSFSVRFSKTKDPMNVFFLRLHIVCKLERLKTNPKTAQNVQEKCKLEYFVKIIQ